ncbi:helix-turn-helix transcriptional regulator [Phyllobacterium lublinensis]|uniref:helix-turn-helix transcriptional regulator n=1 Tax=Phyllobacterium lublinensis TaxID=2875708 RepID=UPI001CD01BA5|nr:AraC family transcriptional regulator [Phyllobacterium sp. 2063]MBZ9656006.1 AraC family transcriptional regulator [Phyllobacterium sp. 2063]
MSEKLHTDHSTLSDPALSKDAVQTDNRYARPPSRKVTRAAQHQLQAAEQYIRANIYNPITIADITAHTGINIRALQRLFRKHYDATPVQMLANLRIAAAHAMIRDEQVTSVRHLAAKFHFSNPGRFSKLFRKIYSRTPSDHIRAINRGQ